MVTATRLLPEMPTASCFPLASARPGSVSSMDGAQARVAGIIAERSWARIRSDLSDGAKKPFAAVRSGAVTVCAWGRILPPGLADEAFVLPTADSDGSGDLPLPLGFCDEDAPGLPTKRHRVSGWTLQAVQDAVVSLAADAPAMSFLASATSRSALSRLGPGWFFGFQDEAVAEGILSLPEKRLCDLAAGRLSGAVSDAEARAVATLEALTLDVVLPPWSMAGIGSTKRCQPAGKRASGPEADFSASGPQVSPEQRDGNTAGPKEALSAAQVSSLLQGLDREPLAERVRARKSDIHGWGLFAKRKLRKGEIVIEYTGHLISSGVADLREQEYAEKKLGGSCYLFRMDDDAIADATLRGSCARFINHSGAPNCDSRVVAGVDGNKAIVIQALRDVDPGEEVTYDYKFPFDFAQSQV
ncbi:hypothetical protein FNF29_00125 [Cafeteria roenbergensis]|uniref:[histone H3]-lysine(4) N-trimethyltransferase n=1 Tax=Cafeteria roenbergensis TaxID=33653 RepID=A0A5A8CXY5_CAFRO|nr:hypothetical protein FNF29_00125 [Cafeteria roenbergensis]|eukprot:KAA0157549.1 hypothetical protein FNF29_00125 [Cafeteria roenbergensis]